MQLISIDVGIKNLAYCILEKDTNAIPGDYKIIKWDSINLCGDEPNCLECKNKASYTKNEQNYCLTHAKKTGFIIPTKDKSPSAIKKINLDLKICNENSNISINQLYYKLFWTNFNRICK